MVLLVALRLALGCHFLYEGVWKIKHQDEFLAEASGFWRRRRGRWQGCFTPCFPTSTAGSGCKAT